MAGAEAAAFKTHSKAQHSGSGGRQPRTHPQLLLVQAARLLLLRIHVVAEQLLQRRELVGVHLGGWRWTTGRLLDQ